MELVRMQHVEWSVLVLNLIKTVYVPLLHRHQPKEQSHFLFDHLVPLFVIVFCCFYFLISITSNKQHILPSGFIIFFLYSLSIRHELGPRHPFPLVCTVGYVATFAVNDALITNQYQHCVRSFHLHPSINGEHEAGQAASTNFYSLRYFPTANWPPPLSFSGVCSTHCTNSRLIVEWISQMQDFQVLGAQTNKWAVCQV